ncbi:helicase-like protein [Ectocarpus siliculosus]|uniref:ATP-dependent DNA helicase n=1 Tax=Ectocarpus siliculosus TaxID=2880 RepID=D7FZD4_ECTSI|nr:helicase-like protein [Ectocarpus siliculosus]|eukprot:CBJ32751.1 helicase-like protein [Ectocarpus siliculosus]
MQQENKWPDDNHALLVYRRRATTKITKIYFLAAPKPTEGDVWYLWLLLKRGGCTPRSFLEARTHRDTTYESFKDTCRARGLLDDPLTQESSLCLQEAIENNASPRQLRSLFILLVVGAKPVAAAFDTYHTHMMEPAWIENHPSETARLLKLLQCLQRHLLAEGCKSVQHLGLNVPEGFVLEDSELQRARVAQLLDHRDKDVDTVLRELAMFTDEQRLVFDTIVNACQSDEAYTFDIKGRAGTGKTVLMNAISAQVRLNNHLTAPAASTANPSNKNPWMGSAPQRPKRPLTPSASARVTRHTP